MQEVSLTAMIIILPLGPTVKAYLRRYGDRSPDFHIACPACGNPAMHKHGRYWRSAVTSRRVLRVPVYRWRCKDCRAAVTVLPDFLAPYKQFVSVVREGVMRRYACGWTISEIASRACTDAASGLSERTVTRWLAKARAKAARWSEFLSNWLLLASPNAALFAQSTRWNGPRALFQAFCALGDLCRAAAPSGQAHPGLYAYCNGLLADLPRL